MNTDKIESVVNTKIINHLNDGSRLIDVYYILLDSIEKFIRREDYLDVSESYLKFNWDSINFKKKYTSYYVVYAKKRRADIMWLIMNSEKNFSQFGPLSDAKLFSLLLLKDKLKQKDHVTS